MATTLVTGASSGIGLCIAQSLMRRGQRVLLLSYDEAELDQVTASQPLAIPVLCDLSRPEQVEGLWDRLESQHGPLEALINNAGIGHQGEVLNTPMERFRLLMEVNYFAPVSLCRQALTAMSRRGQGKILNLTSASARRALARMSGYASSKAALHGFTQALRLEAAPLGIAVSEVLPISVATPFFERAGNSSDRSYRPRGVCQTPQAVADLVLDCLDRGTPEVVSHLPTALGFVVDALFPNLVHRLLARLEQKTSTRRD